MRRLLAIAGLTLCALLLDGSAKPPAECAMCSRTACFDSNTCFRGCACMKSGRDHRGVCVSFDAIP